MKIKAVLLDWNGTVMDDLDVGFQTCNHMLRYYDVPTISKDRFQKTFDVPWFIFYEKNGVSRERINVTKHQKEFMRVYNSLSKKAKPRKNVRKLFEWFKKNKILIGIISSHLEKSIKKDLKKHDLDEYLDVVIGEKTYEEAGTSRNKKVESALSSLKVSKNEVIYVGDTIHDVSVGKKEGFLVVGITNGWQSRDIISEAKPDYLIEDMGELIDIIKKLNGE